MEYLYSASNLYASVWKVAVVRDRDEFQSIVDGLHLTQPQWAASGEKVDLSEGDTEGEDSTEDDEKLKGGLYKVDASTLQPAQPLEFEKDGERPRFCLAIVCIHFDSLSHLHALCLIFQCLMQMISTFTLTS
jgi:hypothetical protein